MGVVSNRGRYQPGEPGGGCINQGGGIRCGVGGAVSTISAIKFSEARVASVWYSAWKIEFLTRETRGELSHFFRGSGGLPVVLCLGQTIF